MKKIIRDADIISNFQLTEPILRKCFFNYEIYCPNGFAYDIYSNAFKKLIGEPLIPATYEKADPNEVLTLIKKHQSDLNYLEEQINKMILHNEQMQEEKIDCQRDIDNEKEEDLNKGIN